MAELKWTNIGDAGQNQAAQLMSNASKDLTAAFGNLMQAPKDMVDLIQEKHAKQLAEEKQANTEWLINQMNQATSLEDVERLKNQGFGTGEYLEAFGGKLDMGAYNQARGQWEIDAQKRNLSVENMLDTSEQGKADIAQFRTLLNNQDWEGAIKLLGDSKNISTSAKNALMQEAESYRASRYTELKDLQAAYEKENATQLQINEAVQKLKQEQLKYRHPNFNDEEWNTQLQLALTGESVIPELNALAIEEKRLNALSENSKRLTENMTASQTAFMQGKGVNDLNSGLTYPELGTGTSTERQTSALKNSVTDTGSNTTASNQIDQAKLNEAVNTSSSSQGTDINNVTAEKRATPAAQTLVSPVNRITTNPYVRRHAANILTLLGEIQSPADLTNMLNDSNKAPVVRGFVQALPDSPFKQALQHAVYNGDYDALKTALKANKENNEMMKYRAIPNAVAHLNGLSISDDAVLLQTSSLLAQSPSENFYSARFLSNSEDKEGTARAQREEALGSLKFSMHPVKGEEAIQAEIDNFKRLMDNTNYNQSTGIWSLDNNKIVKQFSEYVKQGIPPAHIVALLDAALMDSKDYRETGQTADALSGFVRNQIANNSKNDFDAFTNALKSLESAPAITSQFRNAYDQLKDPAVNIMYTTAIFNGKDMHSSYARSNMAYLVGKQEKDETNNSGLNLKNATETFHNSISGVSLTKLQDVTAAGKEAEKLKRQVNSLASSGMITGIGAKQKEYNEAEKLYDMLGRNLEKSLGSEDYSKLVVGYAEYATDPKLTNSQRHKILSEIKGLHPAIRDAIMEHIERINIKSSTK